MLEQETQNGMARRNKQLTEEQTTKDLLELRHTPSNQKKNFGMMLQLLYMYVKLHAF